MPTPFETFVDDRALISSFYPDWPLIAGTLRFSWPDEPWMMEYYERATLAAVVSHLRPAVTIEVGTRFGGSLALFSEYSARTISIDIDPLSAASLRAAHPTIDFRVGDSRIELPRALSEANATATCPIFVFVDGDHSRAGVCADLTMALAITPRVPVIIMGHDSFNPACRQGMLDAPWADNPHVHLVEIDFQHGSLFDRTDPPQQMWGGLYLALLLPTPRPQPLVISQRHERLFTVTKQQSAHASWRKVWHSLKRRLTR